MHFQEHCGDCGEEVGEQKVSKRLNICDGCWERRDWVVTNMNRIVEYFGVKDFQALQRSMAYKTGIAKRKIIKMAKELPSKEVSNE